MRRVIGWIAFALVVAGAIFAFVRYRAAHQPPPVTYTSVKVEKRRLVGSVTTSGTLQATVTVQVGTQVSGRIQKLYADFNSQVKKGQLVAKIDPQLFQAAVDQQQANYVASQAKVVRAKAVTADAEVQLKRAEALSQQSLASGADLQTAQTNLATAKADQEVAAATLEQARASLNQAKVNLEYTNIVSPIDGTVLSRAVDVGQTVAASLSAPTIFTIVEDLRKMQVNTNVSEGDIGRLEEGQTAVFSVDAFPGQKFKGRISTIRNSPQTLQNVVTYDAVIDVDNADLKLRPGMTANVTVTYAHRENVIAVPNAALRFRPPPGAVPSAAAVPTPSTAPSGSAVAVASVDVPTGAAPTNRLRGRSRPPADAGPKTVWLLKNGQPEQVMVKTGLSDGSFTELVESEVAEGDDAITDATVAGGAAAPTASPVRRMF